MRRLADAGRVQAFMRAFSRAATASGRVYFTGGATAVLNGWREATIDVDIKIVPEQDALLRAIPSLKESLELNVELAAPDDFIPVKEGWADRSPFVAQEGRLAFHHFDLCAQALAKIERGHDQDRQDVETMLDRALVTPEQLREYFEAISGRLYRYPAVDEASFRRSLDDLLARRSAPPGPGTGAP